MRSRGLHRTFLLGGSDGEELFGIHKKSGAPGSDADFPKREFADSGLSEPGASQPQLAPGRPAQPG